VLTARVATTDKDYGAWAFNAENVASGIGMALGDDITVTWLNLGIY
jgi:hypothetical protein